MNKLLKFLIKERFALLGFAFGFLAVSIILNSFKKSIIVGIIPAISILIFFILEMIRIKK